MPTFLWVVLACVLQSSILHAEGVEPVLNDLLQFHPTWITRSVTSHDPSGGNDDGAGNGTPAEGQYKVLFHDIGEGRVTRIWMTAWPDGEVQKDWKELWIIADGATVYRGSPVDFFSGRGPYRAPLVMESNLSSGGFLSYAPIPYLHEVKILVKNVPHYFQVTSRQGLGSSQGPSPQELQDFLSQKWWTQVPAPTSQISLSDDHPTVIASGFTPISSLSVQIPKESLKDLMIQIGNQNEVPLSFFFGLATMSLAEFDVAPDGGWQNVTSSLHYVDSEKGLMISRLPIPLQNGEEIKIRSKKIGAQKVSINVGVQGTHAQYSNQGLSGVKLVTHFVEQDGPGQHVSMPYFEATGPTQYVGIVEGIEGGKKDRIYLEGDEIIRTHGMEYPYYLGTGTEDFFNGGWYFNGPHSNPMSGEPRYYDQSRPVHSLYRYMIFDPIVSMNGMRFGFEAGEIGAYQPVHYKTLSFAYEFTNPEQKQKYELNPSQFRSRAHHRKEFLKVDAEAGQNAAQVRDVWSKGTLKAQVNCPPSQSGFVEVIRTYNASVPGQHADIILNNTVRGQFFEATANPKRSLAQQAIVLPLSADDCPQGKMDFELHSSSAFSNIHYTFRYY